MRTTINLPDDLLRSLKRRAAERGTTVTALIEDSLRAALAERSPRKRPKPIRLKTYGQGGFRPGVDLDDSAALLDLMESDSGAAGR
jgi:plasmid stability protein